MKRFLGLIVAVSILFAGSYVMAGSQGSKGAAFLKLGQGARANGMGESFVAVADDINALYWNPAGIAQIKETQAAFMYSNWLEGIQCNYLAYVHPAPIKDGIMGGAITILDSGSIDKYDEVGGLPLAQGTFDGKDIAILASYAKEMMPNCSLGATLKYIQMKIDGKKSTGLGLDVGCLYQHEVENLTFGITMQNLGPKLKAFVSEKNELPLNLKVGGAYKLLDNALTLSMDVNLPSDNDINFNLGAEYWFKEIIAFRTGYKSLTKNELKTSDLTFGAGFILPGVTHGTGIEIDYAYSNYDELDVTQRVSMITKF